MADLAPLSRTLETGETVVIRTATENDSTELLSCMKRIIEDGEGVILLPDEFRRTEERQREWITQYRSDPHSIILLAEVAGRIVGSLDFSAAKRKRFSHTGDFAMTLAPEFRGMGLGLFLLNSLVAWARTKPDIEKINLLVRSSNERAIALYKKFGFVEEGRKRREVKLSDGTYEDNILMALFLRP
jgi:RimJ/RimL family protein N-acetyltransferase